MREPDLVSSFEYNGRVDVEWFDVLKKEKIPNYPWQQVYVIGDFNNKVPIVTYPNAKDNLPGGKVELGESLDQTISREVAEETNMRVTYWEPLGYQVCKRSDNSVPLYQLRAYAKLEKIGNFISDPGGDITGYKLVALDDVNSYIGYGAVGDRLIASAKRHFTSL